MSGTRKIREAMLDCLLSLSFHQSLTKVVDSGSSSPLMIGDTSLLLFSDARRRNLLRRVIAAARELQICFDERRPRVVLKL